MLWNTDSFQTASSLVQSIVSSGCPAKLRIIDDQNQSSIVIPKQYQRMFARALDLSVHLPSFYDDRVVPASSNDTSLYTYDDRKNEDCKGYYSFLLEIAYMGEHFCGWQTQPNNKERPSVQQTLEDWLQPMFEPSRRTKTKKNNRERIETPDSNNKKKKRIIQEPRVNIRVAGRTDAGVHAIGQICRFRTWSKGGGQSTFQWNDVPTTMTSTGVDDDDAVSNSVNELKSPSEKLQEYINQHPLSGTSFRCLRVTPVSSKFHPTFGASCRAYLYLIDASPIEELLKNRSCVQGTLPSIFVKRFVQKLNSILQPLEDQELDYLAMSYGQVKTQSTLCHLMIARAFLVEFNLEETDLKYGSERRRQSALCIQLVGNRFLRRMVRILVSTALREALSMENIPATTSNCDRGKDGYGDDDVASQRLVNVLLSKDRTQSAPPAPPQGLIFASAIFE